MFTTRVQSAKNWKYFL